MKEEQIFLNFVNKEMCFECAVENYLKLEKGYTLQEIIKKLGLEWENKNRYKAQYVLRRFKNGKYWRHS